MPISLINMRSGESHAVDPDRTLLGAAPHADIHMPPGAVHLAALIVEYPSGWVVHPLTEEPPLTLNGRKLAVGQRATPRHEDMLAVDDHRFQFDFDEEERQRPAPAKTKPRVYTCHVTVRGQDDMEEFRVVDHDLLFGRMTICHVQYAYSTLSRLNALLACDHGDWWVFNLAKGPLARNRPGESRVRVDRRAMLESGDELLVGPLQVKFEIPAVAAQAEPPLGFVEEALATPRPKREAGELDEQLSTDFPAPTFDEESSTPMSQPSLHSAGLKLDHWLKTLTPQQQAEKGSWRILKKLTDFWTDTPETTRARTLANSGQLNEAFEVLEKAIRARPENPGLLRELYRLYKTAELNELCYRPLRHIEKVMASRGKPDPWVLEELARVCESLGTKDISMFDRAIQYWTKLENVTGASYARQKQDTLGQRALLEGGFSHDGTKKPTS